MRNISFFYYFTIIFLTFAINSAYGLDFEVKDVPIAAKAQSSKIAKEEALNNGFVEAFKMLVQQLDPAKSENYIEKIGSAKIIAGVENFSVKDEKITNDSYKASLTVTFKRSILAETSENQASHHEKEMLSHKVGAIIYYNDFTQWVRTKYLISKLPSTVITVHSLSNKYSLMDINYNSSIDGLITSLNHHGLKAKQVANILVISLKESGNDETK